MSQDGIITLLGAGEVEITVTYPETTNYKASEAKVSLSVIKDDLEASDFEVTNNEQSYIPNEAKTVTVTPKVDGVTVDDITIKYYQDETEVKSPVEAGIYTVKISVTETAKYNATKEELTVGTLTIGKIAQVTPSIELTKNSVKMTEEAPSIQLNNNADIKEEGKITYTSNNEAVAKVDSNTGTITLVGKGSVEITVTYGETKNYTASQATVTLEVTLDELDENDFEIEEGTNHYSYDPTVERQATVNSKVTGIGEITVKYEKLDEQGNKTGIITNTAKNAGVYNIVIDITEGTSYTAKENLTVGTLTIDKIDQAIPDCYIIVISDCFN